MKGCTDENKGLFYYIFGGMKRWKRTEKCGIRICVVCTVHWVDKVKKDELGRPCRVHGTAEK
jgi:hypothetical protein